MKFKNLLAFFVVLTSTCAFAQKEPLLTKVQPITLDRAIPIVDKEHQIVVSEDDPRIKNAFERQYPFIRKMEQLPLSKLFKTTQGMSRAWIQRNIPDENDLVILESFTKYLGKPVKVISWSRVNLSEDGMLELGYPEKLKAFDQKTGNITLTRWSFRDKDFGLWICEILDGYKGVRITMPTSSQRVSKISGRLWRQRANGVSVPTGQTRSDRQKD
jgi:hypothetical protein